MAGFNVRAVTLHVGRRPADALEYRGAVEDLSTRLLEAVDEAVREGYPRPETVRLVFPDGEAGVLVDAAGEAAEAAGEGVLVSLGGIRASHGALESLLSEAAEAGVYMHVLLDDVSWAAARRLARLLNSVAERDPVQATKIGVNTLGEPVLTPYFPLAHSPGVEDLVTVALTYPNMLAEAYREGGLDALTRAAARAAKTAEDLARLVAGRLGASLGGVDLSVAPWMRETTLGLVELVAGVRLPQPGIAQGILAVNGAVKRAAGTVKSTGFNEVQLPVAEDLKLKARASEGELTARDLARLAGVCLAGLDMAIVPYDENAVAGLILEVAAYAHAAHKPLGVRLIPLSDVDPGDKIDLGRFGHTPVIPV